jgi:type VII secretion-associated protein (TIGR03931 family)
VTGPPGRVAVQVGAHTVRVAATSAGAEPWLVAERPAEGSEVAPLLLELFGAVLEELVVVHPACWPAARVAAVAGGLAGLAGRVSAVPVPLAAAAAGGCAVLDVGHTATEVTWLAADGSVRACRTAQVGGARLDEVLAGRLPALLDGTASDPLAAGSPPTRSATAAAPDPLRVRRLRERLSLLPAVDTELLGPGHRGEIRAADVEQVLAGPLDEAVVLLRSVLDECGPAPVLLIGGLARAPLLAELVDATGCPDVRVAPRPDAAAVLGALRAPAGVPVASSGRDPPASRCTAPGTPFPPPRRRPLRAALLVLLAAALAAGLLGTGVLLFAPGAAVATPAGELVQYGYRLDVPAGWAHTGGLPPRRRVLLTPTATPEGSDLISVERSPLGYDADAERPRALAELRAVFDAAVAGGSLLSGYRSGTHAGRQVVRYEQFDPDGPPVEWFVLLEGDAQFSVGCRHNPAGATEVRAACALVVGSVHRS